MKKLFTLIFIMVSTQLVFAQRDTIDTYAYGGKILKGTVAPADNTETFACMDSLLSGNDETRRFFFKVFRVIVEKSDGALSEVMGLYIKNYMEAHTPEYLGHYKKMNKEERERFNSFLGFEFYAESNDYNTAIDNWFADIISKCESCKNRQQLLTEIKKAVTEKARAIYENN